MKKFLVTLILPIIACAFCSCEEEESPILFSIESISNPENVKIEYYSPDPSCQPKSYQIWANSEESELTIKCTNFAQLSIDNYGPSDGGNWTAKLIDSNTIGITFDKISLDNVDESYSITGCIYVSANNKKGEVSTVIMVTRFTKMTEPLL